MTSTKSERWNWQQWGQWHDPIHKSDLHGLVGKFGCLEQFKRRKIEQRTGAVAPRERISGKLVAGTATHAVLHSLLTTDGAREAALTEGTTIGEPSIRRAFDREFSNATEGLPVEWYGANPDKVVDECIAMLRGVIAVLHKHVGEVVLSEAGFVYEVDGVWLTGSTDLVYRRPGSDALSILDWKTGAQRPHQIDLDHGWEGAIYSGAVHAAHFVPYGNVEARDGESKREAMERACISIARAQESKDGAALAEELDRWGAVRFDEFPERIHTVHLRDFVPYAKAGSKMIDRPEELDHYGLIAPGRVKCAKGDARGPGWYRVQRTEGDAPRLRHLLKAVVGWVRFGRFPAAPGEMCTRCKYREPCLLDGYKPIGQEARALQQSIKGLDFDGFEDFGDAV